MLQYQQQCSICKPDDSCHKTSVVLLSHLVIEKINGGFGTLYRLLIFDGNMLLAFNSCYSLVNISFKFVLSLHMNHYSYVCFVISGSGVHTQIFQLVTCCVFLSMVYFDKWIYCLQCEGENIIFFDEKTHMDCNWHDIWDSHLI